MQQKKTSIKVFVGLDPQYNASIQKSTSFVLTVSYRCWDQSLFKFQLPNHKVGEMKLMNTQTFMINKHGGSKDYQFEAFKYSDECIDLVDYSNWTTYFVADKEPEFDKLASS